MNLLDLNQIEVNRLDKLLFYCYGCDFANNAFQPSIMVEELREHFTNTEIRINIEMLNDNDFINQITDYPGGVFTNGYKLSSKGRRLHKCGGFSDEYLKQKDKLRKENAKIELDVNLIRSNIDLSKSIADTNLSIIGLNNKTGQNYKIQKRLTIAILIAAAVSAAATAIPVVMLIFKKKSDTESSSQMKILETRVQQLEQGQQSQSRIGSPRPKVGKSDSLIKP